jgi:hypothetical protein
MGKHSGAVSAGENIHKDMDQLARPWAFNPPGQKTIPICHLVYGVRGFVRDLQNKAESILSQRGDPCWLGEWEGSI